MTFLNGVTLGVVCALGIVATVVAAVLILASKADDGPSDAERVRQWNRMTPAEVAGLATVEAEAAASWSTEDPAGEIPIVVDPPVDRAYLPQVPDGMVLYRGGAVHPECAERWLRFDLTPVDGCAVWLTDSLKETVT